MKYRILTALAAATLVALLPTPAHADTRPCVTHNEYRNVLLGYTSERVARIFDTNGKLVRHTVQVQPAVTIPASAYGVEFTYVTTWDTTVRRYRTCGSWGTGSVKLTYTQWWQDFTANGVTTHTGPSGLQVVSKVAHVR